MTPETGKGALKIRDVKGNISSQEGAFSAIPCLLMLGTEVTHRRGAGAGSQAPGPAWGLLRGSRAGTPPFIIRIISRCTCD